MWPISIARIDRDSHTTVGAERDVNQIVHYPSWVYRGAAGGIDSAARLKTRDHERAPAARVRITRRCGDALRRCPFVFTRGGSPCAVREPRVKSQ